MIPVVTTGISGVDVVRRQRGQSDEHYRVVPWHNTSTCMEDLTTYLRGCLADAWHTGHNEALLDIEPKQITKILFGTGKVCPDGPAGDLCNYCKTKEIMAYLASVILTVH